MEDQAKYVVRLTEEERQQLEALMRRGRVAATKRRRAQILLKANAVSQGSGATDLEVAQALDVGLATVHRVRQAYVEQGLAAVLERKRPTGRQYRKLDGAQEARLVALACGPAPQGRTRWTIRLLADKLVELEIVDAVDKETVRRTLKKTT